MESPQIETLAQTMAKYDVYELEIIDPKGSKIHLKRAKPSVAATVEVSESRSNPSLETPKTQKVEKDLAKITAPLIGTFYDSPSPEAEVFVTVGQKIKAGQTVCIIEAMKLMNEIIAKDSGTIEEILVKNEQPVQFNQTLFKIKKN
jgi:acetyl-CoA carboxylase biotin carboxyl carrier protein